MADKIYIAAAKGGAGATTVATGLGFALSSAGERTLIVDGDSLCGSALTVSGCANLQLFTVADFKKGMCRAKQTAVQHPLYKNLYIMPTLGCSDSLAAEEAVKEVQELFDYILCDGTAEKACNRAVVVTEPYPPSVKGADAAICRLKDGGTKVSGIIVNKVNGGLLLSGKTDYPEDIAEALHSPLAAVIPEDLMLPIGMWRSSSLKYFKIAAGRLAGKNIRLPYPEQGYTGARGYFRRKMREKI